MVKEIQKAGDKKVTQKVAKKKVPPIRTVQGTSKSASWRAASVFGKVAGSFKRVVNSGIVLLVLLVGVLFRDIAFGEIFLGVYALAAIVFKLSSETSFRMAFVMLLALPIVGLMHNHPLAQNFAVYGFLLLAIGVISALIEQFYLNRATRDTVKNVVKKV